MFSYPSVLTYVWVLKRTIMLKRFFRVPTTYVKVENEKINFLYSPVHITLENIKVLESINPSIDMQSSILLHCAK